MRSRDRPGMTGRGFLVEERASTPAEHCTTNSITLTNPSHPEILFTPPGEGAVLS